MDEEPGSRAHSSTPLGYCIPTGQVVLYCSEYLVIIVSNEDNDHTLSEKEDGFDEDGCLENLPINILCLRMPVQKNSSSISFFSCDSSSISRNVGLSVGRSVCRSVGLSVGPQRVL